MVAVRYNVVTQQPIMFSPERKPKKHVNESATTHHSGCTESSHQQHQQRGICLSSQQPLRHLLPPRCCRVNQAVVCFGG
jgi:hypothetical protein